MIALGLAFAGVASVGVVLVVSAQSTEDIKHGEALVTRNCARCHATMRTGESTRPEAPAFRTLKRRPARLADAFEQERFYTRHHRRNAPVGFGRRAMGRHREVRGSL